MLPPPAIAAAQRATNWCKKSAEAQHSAPGPPKVKVGWKACKLAFETPKWEDPQNGVPLSQAGIPEALMTSKVADKTS